jgi:hypothetical protein
MANAYQLVAWTEKGKVRMIPSEVTAFMQDDLEEIDRLIDRIRYGTDYEVHDILRVSCAYEKLGLRLLEVGRTQDAFLQYAHAAECCCASRNNWEEGEYGEQLCRPLRSRFFAMFSECRELVRRYPTLRYAWVETDLRESYGSVTAAERLWTAEWADWTEEFKAARAFTKALNFGRNELYRHRR